MENPIPKGTYCTIPFINILENYRNAEQVSSRGVRAAGGTWALLRRNTRGPHGDGNVLELGCVNVHMLAVESDSSTARCAHQWENGTGHVASC